MIEDFRGSDSGVASTEGAEDAQRQAAGTNVLRTLEAQLPEMSRSEKRLAKVVLSAPEATAHLTLSAFAEAAGVSQPTAIRFCRRLGCSGYADFRIVIAQAAARGAHHVHREINKGDPLSVLVSKIFASSIDTLQLVSQQLDLDVIERAVELIADAHRIELLGTGLSGVAAEDAHQKFMRLGVPTGLHGDGHLQRMSCETLNPGDVAIAFSYTGQLRDFQRTCEVVLDRGAALIAVTRSETPLAKIATLAIAIDTLENTFVYAPMTTRMAHLAVVDVLATAVALEAGESRVATIRRVKRALRDEWLIESDGDGGESPTPTPDDRQEG